ncbi:uncharacterized protein CC84DRAFT_1108721 [Paraphaeosphaeria sporulosa]|uniref:Uncharacterized protein n=1 Tax=Paraphaeosphaeria sporulosa TaxID=1460663 RepID=A0A177CZ83_9PLEO|nr:uncharacterized protein CC84DRAFT_1108721 [Paraphaeosphaeria sporulosa]OAG12378.1 hypothetical protein CC84DRAFT_1108721 [Paraphaeosphaeria sporulosa]
MSSLSMPTISPALREAANLMAEELEHFKESFTEDIILNLNKAYDQHEARDVILTRLTILLKRVKAYESHGVVDDEFNMWTLQIEQAQDDKSITSEKLISIEKALHHKLERIPNRLAMSEYHITLMDNALDNLEARSKLELVYDNGSLDGEFEVVEEELDRVCTAFEEHAFAQKDTDVKAIEDYLTCLFDDAVGNEQLQMLRQQMTDYGEVLLLGEEKLDTALVEWCIKDLLNNGLLSAERQSRLHGYLDSETAIRELTATLNAKSIRHWNWCNDERGLPVSAQKNANGMFCITVEEKLIDMLFLHSLAMRWGMELKDALRRLTSIRVEHAPPALEEIQKREYYLEGCGPPQPSTCTARHPQMPPVCSMYPPLTPPPPPVPNRHRRHDRTPPRYNLRNIRAHLPPHPPYVPSACLDDERCMLYMRDLFLYRLPDPELSSAHRRRIDVEKQGALLQMLTLDIKAREAFDGSVYGLRANFRSFASSMSHKSVLAILGYMGVSQDWLNFFTRLLGAPLNLCTIFRDTQARIQTRTCGLQIARGFETFFGEAVLVCLDLAVHHRTTSDHATPYLLRQRDECYFVGKKQQCEEARREIETFAQVMDLDVGIEDLFAPASVNVSIHNDRVVAYARRVKMQLAACPTVFAWVRTWNRTIGTYTPHLFGPLTNVFGKAHLDAVKKAYNIMYEIIFDDGNLTRHVTNLLSPLPPGDSSFSQEAWIHLPVVYGGLGVKSPYAYVKSAGSNITMDADAHWKKYLEDETRYYEKAKELFYQLTDKQRERKLKDIFDGDKGRIETVFGIEWKRTTTSFPTLKELTANRERLHLVSPAPPMPFATHYGPYSYPYGSPPQSTVVPPNALSTYQLLASDAPPSDWSVSRRTRDEMDRIQEKLMLNHEALTGIQDKWALGLYGEECFERFGGLEIWDREWVPMELLDKLRRGKT